MLVFYWIKLQGVIFRPNLITFMPVFFFCGRNNLQCARASSFTRFLDHTQWCATVGRTPLDKWSARRQDLYVVTHNNHNRQTSMSPVGFEPTISASERPQTYASDRAANGTGFMTLYYIHYFYIIWWLEDNHFLVETLNSVTWSNKSTNN
jgi:hypothetical protein